MFAVVMYAAPVYWPMFVVATAAAVIASQAMISAVFSIVDQSMALGCFPRCKVIHTSSKYEGQIYIPEINWILMILCIIVTLALRSTTNIGNAYGTLFTHIHITHSFIEEVRRWVCNRGPIFLIILFGMRAIEAEEQTFSYNWLLVYLERRLCCPLVKLWCSFIFKFV